MFKDLFEAIGALFSFLFTPLDSIRFFEDKSWWSANFINFVFITVAFIAILYWLKQLKKFNDNDEEDKTSTSHSYL